MIKTGKLRVGVAALTLSIASGGANASSFFTDIKYELESHYFNLFKAPKPAFDPEGNLWGTITNVDYRIFDNTLVYHMELTWKYHEWLKAGAKERGETKEKIRESLEYELFIDLIEPYCDMAGKLYRFRADGVTVGFSVNLLSFGHMGFSVGEKTCQ